MKEVEKLDWQRTLFRPRLNRFELTRIKPAPSKAEDILRVSRNHGFELVASALLPFLAHAGLDLALEIGEYDDSLSLPPSGAAVELVWLDYDRYRRLNPSELASWLCDRLTHLREQTRAPIVVANATGTGEYDEHVNAMLGAWSRATPGTHILDIHAIAQALGPEAFDDRRAALTGTRLSDPVCMETARTLGFGALPSLLRPNIKAVALDLDHTLYAGVLGEDGPEALDLTQGHKELQSLLLELADRGVFLAIVSRNEREDVERLFSLRGDFPLRSDRIANWQVSWGSKAAAIRTAAAELRIGTDAFLLVDDNLGELTVVGSELPGTRLLFAGHSPEDTTEALRRFPSLWPTSLSSTDALRTADLKANAERQSLSAAMSVSDYLKALEVTLTFELDPTRDLDRLRDISAKTNQFNLALARLSEMDIADYLSQPESWVVHVRLADRLADSGSVAAIYGRKNGDTLVIDELCISCRAMGRSLEDIIVTEAIRRMGEMQPIGAVRFKHAVGPRNQPARRWLEAYAGAALGSEGGMLDVPWTGEQVDRYVNATPVSIRWD